MMMMATIDESRQQDLLNQRLPTTRNEQSGIPRCKLKQTTQIADTLRGNGFEETLL
jgi:hypothetical protein